MQTYLNRTQFFLKQRPFNYFLHKSFSQIIRDQVVNMPLGKDFSVDILQSIN